MSERPHAERTPIRRRLHRTREHDCGRAELIRSPVVRLHQLYACRRGCGDPVIRSSWSFVDIIVIPDLLPFLEPSVDHFNLVHQLETLAQTTEVLPALDRALLPKAQCCR